MITEKQLEEYRKADCCCEKLFEKEPCIVCVILDNLKAFVKIDANSVEEER